MSDWSANGKQGFTDKMKWDSNKYGEQATYYAYYFGNERVNLKVQKSLKYIHVFVQ